MIMPEELEPLKSQCSKILDLPPSCVEFSPLHPHYFVVGTYYLDDAGDGESTEDGNAAGTTQQQRKGSLLLFRYINRELCLVQSLLCPAAILDVKFSPLAPEVFAVATSIGQITFYRLAATPKLQMSLYGGPLQLTNSGLVTALAWHSRLNILGATLSTGKVEALHVDPELQKASAEKASHVHSHTLEAWTLAFAPPHAQASQTSTLCTVFSGGDDAILHSTTFEWIDNAVQTPLRSGLPFRKLHDAGVTAILPLSSYSEVDEYSILLTGSYDDHVRVIDTHSRRVLAEENLGGGVWRLKFLDEAARSTKALQAKDENDALAETGHVRVLASCMHAGVRIVDIIRHIDGRWAIKVLAKFEEHSSMNYGSDVQPLQESQKNPGAERAIVSTSFYDRLLCIWEF